MDNNENSYNSQQNTSADNSNNGQYYQSAGQNYYQSGQQTGQTAGQFDQANQQANQQVNQQANQAAQNANAYGQANQYSQQYGQTNQYNQQYGQTNQYNQQYGQTNAYGQNYNQYTQPQGGYPSNGANVPLTDMNGAPLKNNFGMKLTFSILEIISCNPITIIMGIIGCVFTSKANNSYKARKAEEFKSQAKTASICLWVGLAAFILGIILNIVIGLVGGSGSSSSSSSNHTPGTGTAVTVDGTYIEIPLSFEELEDLGFEIDSYSYGKEVSAYDIEFVAIDNARGDNVMWVWVENESSSTADVTDCTVIGIDVDYNCDNYTSFSTPDGVTFNCSKEDLVNLLGDPDAKDSDYSGRELWRWYLTSQEDSWQVIEITFDDYDYIFDIDIDYRK